MGLLTGKKALIVGIASKRSIAYGIAKSFHEQGAELAFTYQNEKLESRVKDAAETFGANITVPCDVADDQSIENVFSTLREHWDGLDILVHSVAFAPADQLDGEYIDCVNREGFNAAHDISSYSLAALAKAGHKMMEGRNGSILTLTYLGSVKAIPNYNIMGVAKASLEANMRYLAASLGPQGIRVNAISSGPIRTLAASGISGFRSILDYYAKTAPLRRNVTTEDVGNAAAFLCSDMANGITGEVTYVDAGYNIMSVGA